MNSKSQKDGYHIILYQHCSLCISVGGITRKPRIVDDHFEPREYLSITATFDHDITDGAPAARYAQVLKEHIERGHGLLSWVGSESLEGQ